MPKGCTHIACTESTEYPEPRNQGGVIGYPIREIWGKFSYICSTGVISFGGNKLIACFMVQNIHRNLLEIITSQSNSIKM